MITLQINSSLMSNDLHSSSNDRELPRLAEVDYSRASSVLWALASYRTTIHHQVQLWPEVTELLRNRERRWISF